MRVISHSCALHVQFVRYLPVVAAASLPSRRAPEFLLLRSRGTPSSCRSWVPTFGQPTMADLSRVPETDSGRSALAVR